MNWTKWDLGLSGTAIIVVIVLFVARFTEWQQLERDADRLADNVYQLADTVHRYHDNTGRWFPNPAGGEPGLQVYPNPFGDAETYQGLDATYLSREQNAGMVLQLVRYDPGADQLVSAHLFESQLKKGEPYLRVLLDYGDREREQVEALSRLQSRLPDATVAEVDDHYFAVDLRKVK